MAEHVVWSGELTDEGGGAAALDNAVAMLEPGSRAQLVLDLPLPLGQLPQELTTQPLHQALSAAGVAVQAVYWETDSQLVIVWRA